MDICNYYEARVRIRNGDDVCVLLNFIYPLIGFASRTTGLGAPPNFIDHDELHNVFLDLGRYTVLSKSELEEPVTDDSTALLSKAELSQLKYWKPGVDPNHWTVGRVE